MMQFDSTKSCRETICKDNVQPEDVLLGINPSLRKHPGNVQLRELVITSYEDYDNATKTKKTDIANDVFQCIHSGGGRFLKQVGKHKWKSIDQIEARKKISSSFRGFRKKIGRKLSNDSEHSGTTTSMGITFDNRMNSDMGMLEWSDVTDQKMVDHTASSDLDKSVRSVAIDDFATFLKKRASARKVIIGTTDEFHPDKTESGDAKSHLGGQENEEEFDVLCCGFNELDGKIKTVDPSDLSTF